VADRGHGVPDLDIESRPKLVRVEEANFGTLHHSWHQIVQKSGVGKLIEKKSSQVAIIV